MEHYSHPLSLSLSLSLVWLTETIEKHSQHSEHFLMILSPCAAEATFTQRTSPRFYENHLNPVMLVFI